MMPDEAGLPHLTMQELEAGLDEIRRAPKDGGVLRLIVRRSQEDARAIALVARWR